MNEREYELLQAELKRLQQEVDLLREQQAREVEPPLHLALVVSVSEKKDRAIVLTSKRTLIESSVSYRIKGVVKPNMVVGLTRIGLNVVKMINMDTSEFKRIVYERSVD